MIKVVQYLAPLRYANDDGGIVLFVKTLQFDAATYEPQAACYIHLTLSTARPSLLRFHV
jgi:hypothetical protein